MDSPENVVALGHPDRRRARAALDRSIPPPCQSVCPLHMSIREYVDLVAQGKIMEALQVIRYDNPFPSICAYVCTHPCEDACRRGQVDKPVAIRALKRFAVEFGGDKMVQAEADTRFHQKVAIVGSGPAGLACAYYLRRIGYATTVFEAHSEIGGMLRVGIPEYRLPRDVLGTEVQRLVTMGVEIRTSTRIISLDLLFDMGYEAIFVTIGAHQGLRIGIDGEESPGVVDGAAFLREVNLGLRPNLGERVAVVGGGNVAVDAARTAIRLGTPSVTILYRRSRTEMPASEAEIEQALEEGVDIQFLVAPSSISRRNGMLAVTCVRMELAEPDAGGRRQPAPVAGSEFTEDHDSLIVAIGQGPSTPTEFGVRTGKGSTIQVDPETLTTNRPGVFAGGDAVTGPATVVAALAAGRRAAFRIHDYLQHRYPLPEKDMTQSTMGELLPETVEMIRKVNRQDLPTASASTRTRSFELVELGYNWEAAVDEARRCLRCGVGAEIIFQDKCASCLTCLRVCPYRVPRLDAAGTVQIPPDQCQACGVCIAECPAKAIAMRKPYDRRHVTEELDHALRSAPESGLNPLIVGFCCQYGLFGTGELSGLLRRAKAGIWIVPVLCMGKVEEDHVLRAFEMGAAGVFIAGCGEQCARENTGFWVRQRVEKVRRTLAQAGLEPERVELFITVQSDGKDVATELDRFADRIGNLYLSSVIEQEVRVDSR
jgi:formate dehydrogenase beta subunit